MVPITETLRPALLANENVPAPLVRMLRAAGVDVEFVVETMRAAPDRMVLEHAAATGRWILTLDRDYGELVFARKAPPPAIIYLKQAPLSTEAFAHRILALVSRAGEVTGHLVVVEDRRIRLRALPGRSPDYDG
jgi:predicted nuclease of predicted toxin-antitoxin system